MADTEAQYRIFCSPTEAKNLPPTVTVEEEYEAIQEIRKQYPAEKLSASKPPPEIPEVADLPAAIAEPQPKAPYFQVVWFRAPVRPEWIKEIEETACQPLDPIGSSTIVVQCPNKKSLARLKNLSTLTRIVSYVPEIEVSAEFFESIGYQIDEAAIAEAVAKVATAEIKPRSRNSLTVPGILIASFFPKIYASAPNERCAVKESAISESRARGI